MSTYTETTQASYGDTAGLPTRQRWQILVGVSVAVILAVATAIFVNESDPPVVEQPLQPVAQGFAGADNLAMRSELSAPGFVELDEGLVRDTQDAGLVRVAPEGAVDSSAAPLRSNAISAIEARGTAFADEWTISGYFGQPEAGSLTEPHVPMANNQTR